MTALSAAWPARRGGTHWLALSILWLTGAIVLALALLVATIRLVSIVPATLVATVRAPSAAALLALVVAAAAAVVIAALIAERRGSWRVALTLAFALLIALRLVAIALFTSPIESDWRAYVELANGMLNGEGFWAPRATGYPALLAGAFAVGGRQPLSGELLNVVAAALTGAVLTALMLPRLGRRAALAGLLIYAVMPSQVLFAVILGTETVYAGLLLLLVLLVIRTLERGLPWAALLGITFGLAQYVRPTSQYLLPAALVVLFLAGVGMRRAASLAVVAVLGFGLVAAPIVAWNWDENGRLSLAPYLYDGWSLYVGLGVENDGRFNHEDDQRVLDALGSQAPPTDPTGIGTGRFYPGLVEWQRRYNEVAGRLAIERLRSNGIATLTMQPAKFNELWAKADQASHWIHRHATAGPDLAVRRLLAAVSQAGWVLLLLGALSGVLLPLWAYRRSGPTRRPPLSPEVTTILVFVIMTALIHTLAQVNDRFHEYLVPALCALAGVGWLGVAERVRLPSRIHPVNRLPVKGEEGRSPS